MKEQLTFTITKEHLLLAKNMYVEWYDAEFGAPTIDPKRPYGNSDVTTDICRLLKLKPITVEDETYFRNKNQEYAEKLHKEMQTALQIFLTTQSFEVGTYHKKEEYNDRSWIKLK